MADGALVTQAAWANKQPSMGSLQRAATQGWTPEQWAEGLSRMKSQVAGAQSRAAQGLSRAGVVDPQALAAIQAEAAAARAGGVAALERAEMAYQTEARKAWEQYKERRRNRVLNMIFGGIGLAAGIAHDVREQRLRRQMLNAMRDRMSVSQEPGIVPPVPDIGMLSQDQPLDIAYTDTVALPADMSDKGAAAAAMAGMSYF